jgi:alpha-tubulin suppressor-like RCC1 family protein
LLDTGAIKCWAGTRRDSSAAAAITLRRTPTDVTGLSSGISAVAADNFSSCALTNGGGVKCWGRNEFTGQLGDGTSAQNRFAPVDVTGLGSGVTAVSVGARHACALIANGVKCWGKNNLGQLGIGTFTNNAQTTPIDVTGLTTGVLAISAGDSHTCALKNTGGVKCWGLNGNGQVGDGTSGAGNNRSLPTDVVGLTSGVDAISSGYRHTCAGDHGRRGEVLGCEPQRRAGQRHEYPEFDARSTSRACPRAYPRLPPAPFTAAPRLRAAASSAGAGILRGAGQWHRSSTASFRSMSRASPPASPR